MTALLAALWLCAAEPGLGEQPPLPPEPLKWGFTVALGPDALTASLTRLDTVAVWSELELTYRVGRWLRLAALLGAAYSPSNQPNFPGQHGAFRALGGADLLLPIRSAELFFGVAGGAQHTNLFGDEDYPPHAGYSTPWGTGLALLARLGADLHLSRSVSMGGSLAYEFFAAYSDAYHSAELRWRLTFLF